MKYIPGFKFIMLGTQNDSQVRGIKRSPLAVGSKTFVKSPIDGLDLNKPYELVYIKPIYDDNKNLIHLIYTFTHTIPGVVRYKKNITFNSVKEAEDIFDLITNKDSVKNKEQPSDNLREKLMNRTPLSSSDIRNNRNRRR